MQEAPFIVPASKSPLSLNRRMQVFTEDRFIPSLSATSAGVASPPADRIASMIFL